MAGVKGRSGTNKGQDRPFRDALRRAVMEADGDEKKLHRIARALVSQAASGDVSAIREVADRLDGKPRQESDLTINDNRDPSTLSDAELAAIIARGRSSGVDADAAEDTPVTH
jgi:HPt (histidine-containing phosphotransfer) domain-containing protein